jgi:hypothetical protein
MRMKNLVILVAALVVLSATVSATMTITHGESIYNLEDTLSLNAHVQASENTNGFLSIGLYCGEGSVELYRSPMSLSAGASRDVNLDIVLTRSIVSQLSGDCTLRGDYGNDHVETSTFQIQKTITLRLESADSPLEPGQNVFIRGTAIKANGDSPRGTISASNDALRLRYTGAIVNGTFTLNFTIPDSVPAGRHVVILQASERSSEGELTNEGTIETTLIVKSVLRSIDVGLSETQSMTPNATIVYQVDAYDQSGQHMSDDARVIISQPNGESFAEQLVHTGRSVSFVLPQYAQPGYWKIEAVIEGVDNRRLFYVEEYEHASFEITNATLIVSNTGNVPYRKSVEIVIGDYRELMDVELPVGGMKRYTLRAPDNTYSVKVYDGVEDFLASNVALTGRAIDIGEVGAVGGTLKNLWWVAILAIAGLAVATNVYLRYRTPSQRIVEPLPLSATKFRSLPSKTTMDGAKEQAVGVAIRLEGANGEEAITPLLTDAQKKGARVYTHGEHHVVLFSPRLTRSVNPEMLAIRLAKDAEQALAQHNQKSKQKARFGVGAARGEIISEMKNGEFSFTATTSFIPSAKRLASSSDAQTLVSHELYTMIMGNVKAEKARNVDAWRVLSLKDRGTHDGFIAGFLKRQE